MGPLLVSNRSAENAVISEARSRLVLLSTHPIQYHGHWFRALAERPEIDLTVIYCHPSTPANQARAGFGVEFDWDIPLLDGYRYTFLGTRNENSRGSGAPSAQGMEPLLAREKPDVVMINGWHYRAAWQAIFACWRMRIPVMVRGDSQLISPRGALKRRLKYPVYRSFIPRFDACLAVGARSREYYLHYGARPERVFHVPHAVQDDLFPRGGEAQARRVALRQQWKLDYRGTVFLFAGKFIEKKRPMDFLRAMEIVTKLEPKIAGVMVGDGPLRAACEQFVNERQLPVHFAGFLNQSQMADAYVGSDCLVLPSDGRETWGLVVNEAMSCARPAVVSDAVGCTPDLILDGITGAIFPLGDVDALSRILIALGRSPERLQAMGERGQERLPRYSRDVALRGTIEAVEAVMANRRTK